MPNATDHPRTLAAPHLLDEWDADVLDVSAAARLAGLTSNHLHTLIREGAGPKSFRDTSGTKVPRPELEEWLLHREHAAQPVRRARVRSACRNFRWLPLEPLRLAVPDFTAGRLAELADVSLRTATRWVVVDELPYYPADRAACALGFHPCLIWGPDWWIDRPKDSDCP